MTEVFLYALKQVENETSAEAEIAKDYLAAIRSILLMGRRQIIILDSPVDNFPFHIKKVE
ncbi:hypothetical protein SD70_13465 [Gordoniibacillus kamchatkensis]|uniref:Uncharacterized protein n=1 Tax=Gordoniibacillus kamchatkensis TaxID=1590651 RepID=A0ABR5AH82_9BACL|nr:hypothetical protein SD70_13465 [Paenibacillus sp. VKM B-2647]